MPANPILICAPNADLREHLDKALRNAGYETTTVKSPAAAVASLRDSPIDLVVAEGLAVSGAIGALRTAAPRSPVPVMVVSPAGDVEARIAFMEAGADDVIESAFAQRELEGRVEALLIHSGRLRVTDRLGVGAGGLITFFSPKGGVGTTTLAVNTAVLFARGGTATGSATRSRVLLIDLDLQFGQVATHLNLTPRFDIALLAADEQAMNDPRLAETYITRHPSGISVLAAPTTPSAENRISTDDVQRIISLFRPSYEQIVIDAGSRLDDRTLWALEQADSIVFVVFPEVPALRATTMLLSYLAEASVVTSKAHFVVNHVFARDLLKTRDIANLLPSPPMAEIPFTDVDMIRAVDVGVPVVLGRPQSPAAVAMRQLAQALLGVPAASAAAKARPLRKAFLIRGS
jgi:pilus assembly protein CpaE